MASGKVLTIAQTAMRVLEDLFPQVQAVHGTLVTVVRKQIDGKLAVSKQELRRKAYASKYWSSQPDGEYELYVTQGGIRNREIPRGEKESLVHFLKPDFDFDEDGTKAFCGNFKVLVVGGEVTQIRLEHK